MKFKYTLRRLWGVGQYSEDIGTQVARGGVIIFAGKFLTKAIQFARTIVLARLLFPEDFGLFGMAALAIGFVDNFFQTGLNTALVREKGEVKRFLNTVWTVNLARNTLLGIFVFLAAPLAAAFFQNENIEFITRVLALSIFFTGLENVGVVLLQKEMRFNRKVLYDLSYVLLEVITVVVAALVLGNVWALVVGAVASRLYAAIMSYLVHPYRPRLEFDFAAWKHLFSFSKWVSIMAVLFYLINQGDYIVIGKMLTPEYLGYYQLAFSLALLPAVEFVRMLNNVLFPLYARFQEDRVFLRRSFLKTARLIFAVSIPALIGLLTLAPEIVREIYGEKWLPMVPIVAVLVLYSAAKSFEHMTIPLFLATKKPKVSTFAAVIQLVIMGILLIPLAEKFGVVGVAWGMFLSGLASALFMFFFIRREIKVGFRAILKLVFLPLLASIFMFVVLSETKTILKITQAPLLVIYVLYGIIVYASSLFLLDRMAGRKIYKSILWLRKKL